MNIDFLLTIVESIAKGNFVTITTDERSDHFYEMIATHSNGKEMVSFQAWLDPFAKSHRNNKYISMSIKYYGHPVVYTCWRTGTEPTAEQTKIFKIRQLLTDRLKIQQMHESLYKKAVFLEMQKTRHLKR